MASTAACLYLWLSLFFLFGLIPSAWSGETLLKADFEQGDLTNPLAWEVIRGSASIQPQKDGGKSLAIKGDSLVVSPSLQCDDYTILFRASGDLSTELIVIFLYQDADNYYSIHLGGDKYRGIYRMFHGKDELIDDDVLGKLTLPRKAKASAMYKIYVKREKSKLCVQIDKDGDPVDYDTWITEVDGAALSAFPCNRFGFACQDKANGYFDDVSVTTGKVNVVYQGLVYNVDAAQGDDGRSPQDATNRATPWKTIQKAAAIAVAGDTVLVAPGIYREMVVPANRGGRDAPIVFRAADSKNRPVITGAETLDAAGWRSVDIVDFNGVTHKVLQRPLVSDVTAIFQAGKPLMVSQEPNQEDARDVYALKFFRDVPKQMSNQILTDPVFLIQKDRDYWKGATLLLNNNPPTLTDEYPIIGYDPQTHSLQIKPLPKPIIGGVNSKDRYAIRNHLGILDQPGEYCIDRSTSPSLLYAYPYQDLPVDGIEVVVRENGVAFSEGRENIIIDGFVMKHCSRYGVALSTGLVHDARYITIRNCEAIENGYHGMGGGSVRDITIEGCLVKGNAHNGIGFGSGSGFKIINCTITANGNNGVTIGSGGRKRYWAVDGVLIRGCRFTEATAKRWHPDHFQMHMVRNIILEDNVFIQNGEQNIWCQYTDEFTIRNNIFVGGKVGVNSSIHSYLYNNLFWDATVRYDAHLDDHPEYKDFYKPQSAVVRNNLFVNCSSGRPKQLDCDKIFTSDHNAYCFADKKTRDNNTGRGGQDDGTIILTGMENVVRLIKVPPSDKYQGFDFHLAKDSQLIDAGMNAPLQNDMEGKARPVGKALDIGPYEAPAP